MLNQIFLMGRLTAAPELKTTQSGTSVTNITLAVDRDYSGRDGGEKQTDFIACTAWGKTAEFVSKWFSKGSPACVTGRLQSRQWVDKDDNKRVSWEVNVDKIYFAGKNPEVRPAEESAEPAHFEELSESEKDGDLPF